jgi:hypothetical protein
LYYIFQLLYKLASQALEPKAKFNCSGNEECMARKESAATYNAGWSLAPGVHTGPHRVYELVLTVPRGNFPTRLVLGLADERDGETEEIMDFIQTIEPQLLAMRIDINDRGIPARDWCGKRYVRFQTFIYGLNLSLRSDKDAAQFLNQLAFILGYPPINRYTIQREYDVPVKVDGKVEWINEGWRLAEQSGASM